MRWESYFFYFLSGIVCVCLLVVDASENEAVERNGNVDTLQTYPQNLNLTGTVQ